MTDVPNWQTSVIRVGDGRGFVVAHDRDYHVITGAHCLPERPPPHGASYLEERTYGTLLARLGEEPRVACECLFVDPVADLAILGTPDTQALVEQAEAYDELVEAADPLPIATLKFVRKRHKLPTGKAFLGRPEAAADAWLLGLDGHWFSCRLTARRAIWITDAAAPTVGGMSGSPIVTQNGAVGVLCISSGGSGDHHGGGPNPYLPASLPGWMLAASGGSVDGRRGRR